MLNKFLEFTWIELKIYLRDPSAIFWTFLFPFLILFIFMAVFSDENESFISTKLKIVEAQESEYATRFAANVDTVLANVSLPIKVERNANVPAEKKPEKDEILIRFSTNFDNEYSDSGSAEIEVQYNSNANNSTLAVLAILDSLNNDFNIQQNRWKLRSQLNLVAVGELDIEENLSTAQFLTSGLIGMSLLSTCLFGFSVLIVQMRANEAFKMYQVLPLSPLFYLMAFIVSRLVVMVAFSIIFVLTADFIYELNLTYSLSQIFYFLSIIIIGSVTFLSIGILFASRTSSVSTANGISNLIYFPLIFLSGLFFPISSSHDWLNNLASILPLKSYVEMLRGVVFEGGDLSQYVNTLLILIIWTVLSLTLTTRIFVWNSK